MFVNGNSDDFRIDSGRIVAPRPSEITAVRVLADSISATTFGALPMAANAQDEATTPKAAAAPSNLGTVEVLGSRIKRVDVEGPSPVTVINREQIVNNRNLLAVVDFVYMTSMIGKRVSAARQLAANSAVPTSPVKSE